MSGGSGRGSEPARGKVPGRCLGRVGCNGRLFVVKGFRVGSE